MKSSFEELKKSGLEIKNLQLFRTALTHSSYIHEHSGKYSNERLEFLGDAVLDLIIGDILYKKYEKWPEGTLSRVRASLVRESVLAKVAKELSLGQHLLMGRGEEQSGGREKASILADTYEALLGAVYLDEGLDAAKRFVEITMKEWIGKAKNFEQKLPDSKTRLQELLQENGPVLIKYQLEEKTGNPSNQIFTVSLLVNEVKESSGTGKSKKEAEQDAASNYLQKIEK